ncbi:unnamed protein product [Phaedon cochleariae]|uniref:Tesmin/TSO1-like CXC domain-containing protein n=1 Tax=Phaedon cochleariae TaxID=80249 RepID=A0A9N9X072_PHACE|nr:unnamed protein product [Phaedon cochleariae]
MSRDAASLNLLTTISCRCTTGCMGACDCRKAGLHCSALCKFCADQECNNRDEVIVDNEDDADLVTNSQFDENKDTDLNNSPPTKRAKRM